MSEKYVEIRAWKDGDKFVTAVTSNRDTGEDRQVYKKEFDTWQEAEVQHKQLVSMTVNSAMCNYCSYDHMTLTEQSEPEYLLWRCSGCDS